MWGDRGIYKGWQTCALGCLVSNRAQEVINWTNRIMTVKQRYTTCYDLKSNDTGWAWQRDWENIFFATEARNCYCPNWKSGGQYCEQTNFIQDETYSGDPAYFYNSLYIGNRVNILAGRFLCALSQILGKIEKIQVGFFLRNMGAPQVQRSFK